MGWTERDQEKLDRIVERGTSYIGRNGRMFCPQLEDEEQYNELIERKAAAMMEARDEG